MSFWSLRRSLVIGINVAVIIVLAITAWASYRDILHELDEVFDAQLAQMAKSVAAFYSPPTDTHATAKRIPLSKYHDVGEEDPLKEKGPSGHKYESKIGYHIYRTDGARMAFTNQPEVLPLKHLSAGYHTVMSEQQKWFVYSYYAEEKKIWVHTFQREDVRSELGGYLASEQVYPLVLMWVPISLIVLFIVYLVLKPVNQFSRDLRSRAIDNLSPITSDLPKELVPIKAAVNKLLYQIARFSEREKRFIADASHELRTPLSAIQIHAENIMYSDDLKESKRSGDAIYRSIERMTHLVNQLLRLNRLDSAIDPIDFKECDLKLIVSKAIDELPMNLVEQFRWQVSTEMIVIKCNEALMISALTNLFSNAMKFSPVGSQIKCEVLERADEVEIRVTDQGEGVSQEALTVLGERFYRFREHTGVSGAGLGLSIVLKIVQLHHGEVTFKNKLPRGFEVIVRLPKKRLPRFYGDIYQDT